MNRRLYSVLVAVGLAGAALWVTRRVSGAARLTLTPPVLPTSLTAASPFAFDVGVSNAGSAPASVYVNAWFTHLTDPMANFGSTKPTLNVPAGGAVSQAFSFAPADFEILAWPLGSYNLVIEFFTLPENKRAIRWQSPTPIVVA